MFETVLFPVDSTRESREAAEMVAKLVKTHNSRLILLAVADESSQGQMGSPEAVAELLKNAHTLFAQQEIEAETIERQGNPPFVICDVADDRGVDLIVMGCRGDLPAESEESEHTIDRIVGFSPCPILVVP